MTKLQAYLLKFKAFIYRHTGIYLAKREELAYAKSKEFWNAMHTALSQPGQDLSTQHLQWILIGSWQAKHGFVRPMRLSLRDAEKFADMLENPPPPNQALKDAIKRHKEQVKKE